MNPDLWLLVAAVVVVPAVLIPVWWRARLAWDSKVLLIALSCLPLVLVPHWASWGVVVVALLAMVFVALVNVLRALA